MTDGHAKAEMVAALEGLSSQMRTIARIQQQRAELTAVGTARNGRVRVTVNADGALIETRFGDDIDDLDYGEIAKAVTEAAQQAMAEVSRRGQELMAPLHDERAQLPKMSDLIEGLPDVNAPLPRVSLASPGDRKRETGDGATMTFTDVEHVDPNNPDGHVTDSLW
ncbi:YbaB/EbfC family nucleoid-associated protein [Nocardia sp. CA-107356]|uniref:YbaB/EbfC family nucleoid-associated protein n=1 Tax=Nocardia sp. CA-107356 TaxID=3239972 RepID=UPI003D924614